MNNNMKDELIQALQIVLIVIVCIFGLIFFNQYLLIQEQIKVMNKNLNEQKIELSDLQDELKHNDSIMKKVLEKEW